MKFEAYVTYPDGRQIQVKNLGYMLRNWKDIEAIQVAKFEPEPEDKEKHPGRLYADAFMSVDFKDGRTYTTGFMDKKILADFLDRPVLRGLPVYWFGEELTIGKDTLKV
jgi:hypothetical protein